MKNRLLIACVFLGFASMHVSAQSNTNTKSCIPCEQLRELRLPDVKILEAKELKSDTIEGQAIISVPFCRVLGRISKEINFELLLPLQWNGRFLMSGGGGFVGSIQNWHQSRVNDGFATAGTDTGHKGSGVDASWALNNMERQMNFGRLAIHLTTVVSKSVIHAYYCKDPAYSYFSGCSRGGGQAMVEAQIYPDDFEGIIAGAPAFSWPAIGAKFVQNCQANYPNPGNLSKPVVTIENLKLLQNEILKQCDGLDGITDHILNDPRDCKFNFSSLPVCPGDQPGENCFTSKQLAAIKTVYASAADKQNFIYPGFPYGGENEPGGWDIWISGTNPSVNMPSLHYQFGTNIFKYLVFNDPDWDYSKYDFGSFFEDTRYASAYLDATSTDYNDFKKRGGKMIMYHGWNDAALSAFATIRHYQEVEQKDKAVQSYIRLFLLPGVLHCNGGPGPGDVDWVKLIRDWVENNKAPERVVMSKMEKGNVVMTRPVYPYPKVTVYVGKGDTNQEKNFTDRK